MNRINQQIKPQTELTKSGNVATVILEGSQWPEVSVHLWVLSCFQLWCSSRKPFWLLLLETYSCFSKALPDSCILSPVHTPTIALEDQPLFLSSDLQHIMFFLTLGSWLCLLFHRKYRKGNRISEAAITSQNLPDISPTGAATAGQCHCVSPSHTPLLLL